MKPWAIIPARGGSQRIPRKNIKLFAGLPIIAHPIRAALASGLFSRIVVSTDDPEIARVAREHGAETPFPRPADLAGPHTPTAPVLAHALRALEAHGPLPTQCCLIYPTAAFVDPETLRRGLAVLLDTGATTALSAAPHPASIFRALRTDEDGLLRMVWPENMHVRSQDLPQTYYDAGQFYWCDTRGFLAEGELYARRTAPVVLSRLQAQDIDTPDDWELAEALFLARRGLELARGHGGGRGEAVLPFVERMLRLAAPEDCRPVFELANDPDVRASAFHSEPIGWAGHERWFAARLGSPATRMLVLDGGDSLAGLVRYDRVALGVAEIDIAVAHPFRGRGVGTAMLRVSAGQACAELGASRLRARVKAGNLASLQAFRKAGFAVNENMSDASTVTLERPAP